VDAVNDFRFVRKPLWELFMHVYNAIYNRHMIDNRLCLAFAIRCECVNGYSGRLCQVDIDNCEPNLCLNGATCVDGVASFSCRCPPGFNGTRCETGIEGKR